MNTAGAYFATVTLMEADAACPVSERTTSGYRPAASVGGSCALICVGEVASSESGVLLSVTQAPPSSVGSGELAAVAADARFEPKIEIRPPGATAVQIVGRIHDAIARYLGKVLLGGGRQRNHAQSGSRQHKRRGAGRIQHHAAAGDVDSRPGACNRRSDFERARRSGGALRIHIHHFHQARVRRA